MKKYILMLSIVLGTMFLTHAQKIPTPVELATKKIESFTKKIKVNTTQRNVIYNYMLDISKTQVDLAKKQQAGLFNPEDLGKFYKLQNESNENIRNILKGDQQTDFDKFIEEELRGGQKKKKKGKHGKEEDEEVVTGISGLKLPS
ncbi:protein CpxP [Pedobacter sp. CG_S7]|uniref:hypothetical protein n=1 Tax=Pedobacter sp. CG_S7 TaxID=3143930 RepID=UPI003399F219